MNSFRTRGTAVLFAVSVGLVVRAEGQTEKTTADQIAALSPDVLSEELRERFKNQTWRSLRARGDAANRRDIEIWRAIETRHDWERARDERLASLQASLGTFPGKPDQLDVRVTGTIEGDGFVIENLVFRTRLDFWVTANLYAPVSPGREMPGILIAHSHHRPKTQDELQDMGMTWARQGCLVLVIDQVGHGERAQHPFQGTDDYRKKNSGYKWWRQDYYYRFDTNVQLELVGQSLMGWMVWDLMRGVDLLLARPGIDQKKIILLGAVAGGGDPAAVTAALDRRIACVVPFNFGGPQPETRYPLPDDADLHFNYLGGAYWESTRNLRRTGSDSFFAWSIVASVIPRRLVYAHEFSWDRKRDPVWKRLNRLYEFYGEPGNIDYTVGRGSVKGRPPESTHCTNIGRHHRQRIHAAFDRWFNIKVTQDDEYTQPRRPEELRSMTEHARSELKPRRPFELLAEIGHEQVAAVRRQMTGQSATARLRQVRQAWQQRLGDIVPRKNMHVLSETAGTIAGSRITVHRIALQTEPGIVVPMILLSPEQAGDSPLRTVVAVSQSGRREFLRTRSREIASLLEGGAAVCLPDMRDVGTDRGSRGEGSNGSISYYALFFETPMLGYRLRDLRSVLRYLRTRNGPEAEFALWGDSFAQPNPADTDFQVPKRVSGRPGFSEPLGGLLALLAAVYEDEIKVVYVHGGLSSYQDVLAGPYVYVPHDAIVPGVLLSGDIADLAASLAPRPLKLEGTVDALNRRLSPDALRTTYEPVTRTYAAENADSASYSTDRSNPAGWILKSLER